MKNLKPTKREFTDVETGKRFRLYHDSEKDNYELIFENKKNEPLEMASGTRISGYYLAGHNSITIKLNTKKEIKIPMGFFYHFKEDEELTHKKYTGLQKRFTKI